MATEAEIKSKPTLMIVSKMNVSFNVPAAKLLALKAGDQFQLILKGDKLFYKDVQKDGFQISVVNNKGASFITRGLHPLLNEKYRKSEKSFRFRIGLFSEGMRLLIPEE